MTGCGCGQTDPHQLVRDGTGRHQRALPALDPANVPIDERRPEHHMVFAAGYARHLRFHDLTGAHVGNWEQFFASDISVLLAVAATEDVAAYRNTLKILLRELTDPELPVSEPAMQAALQAVFDALGTLARRLDELAGQLPMGQALRATLGNLIAGRLSPMLRRLIGYHEVGTTLGVLTGTSAPAPTRILGKPLEPFTTLLAAGLEQPEWADGVDASSWAAYLAVDPADHQGAWGTSAYLADQANHLATHNLFTAICDTFLAVFARLTDEARTALADSLAWPGHHPHYALFLAFLQLLEHARTQTNQLTANHLDFYYRRVLGMSRRPAAPSHAHLLVELAKHAEAHLLEAGTRARAGKDDTGTPAHVALDADLAATRAAVVDIRRLYRHLTAPPLGELPLDTDRLFASVVEAESWHPFAETLHADGALTGIAMPPARVGFAVASHLLRLAGGARRITLTLATAEPFGESAMAVDLLCRLTTEDGWLDKTVTSLTMEGTTLSLELELDGNDPPVTGFDAAVHQHPFETAQPVLLVLLQHSDDRKWDYQQLAGIRLTGIEVSVQVTGLRRLTISNDHAPVDPSKPFLAFGATPAKGSSLVIGSREALGKPLSHLALNLTYQTKPVASGLTVPTLTLQYLNDGAWSGTLAGPFSLPSTDTDLTESYTLTDAQLVNLDQPTPEVPDAAADEPLSPTSRAGFLRLVLGGGFGTDTYPVELAKYLADKRTTAPSIPVLPTVNELTLDYTARQELALDAPSEADGRVIHVTPFGHATAGPDGAGVPLLPQFHVEGSDAEGELYLGIQDLRPPATLSLLFQVEDGTANPLVVKPAEHIQWAYLRGNQWVPFPTEAVGDSTAGLLASGIVTLAVPADADSAHSLLPDGLHWIRLAVASRTDAVSRLRLVAAQAVRATSATREDGMWSHTTDLPAGTVAKLDPPEAAVKSVTQPFPMFGGRADEAPGDFATRVSERLRHKDRAIALWDYERLVLEAFPDLYQVRCLNHTRYEPSESGTGKYSELAPGHVTVVTIPDLRRPNPLDPLRPATSLRVLTRVQQFLAERISCFATLHVRNPQFEEVRVDLRVRFRNGADEALTRTRLQDDITAFLSPWAFQVDQPPSFNGVIRKSVLVDFVEERPYVDFVTDVKLFHRLPGTPDGVDGPDLAQVVGSRAVSILVSVPSHRHGVRPIPATQEAGQNCGCAEAMR